MRAAVGDRYVLEQMRAGGYTLGGEQSGHVIDFRHNTTGDGPRTAMTLLGIVAAQRHDAARAGARGRVRAASLAQRSHEPPRSARTYRAVRDAIAAAEAALGRVGTAFRSRRREPSR